MRKQYTTPKMEVVVTDPSEIICASTGFGDGKTSTMGARERGERKSNDLFGDGSLMAE